MKINEQDRKEKIEKAIENGTIHEKQRIKNLPELCRIIGIENPGTSTHNRNSLMKELGAHCEYQKDGQAFIIKSIITNPTPRKKNSGGAHNTTWTFADDWFRAMLLSHMDIITKNDSISKLSIACNVLNLTDKDALTLSYDNKRKHKFYYNNRISTSDRYLFDTYCKLVSEKTKNYVRQRLEYLKKYGYIDYEKAKMAIVVNDETKRAKHISIKGHEKRYDEIDESVLNNDNLYEDVPDCKGLSRRNCFYYGKNAKNYHEYRYTLMYSIQEDDEFRKILGISDYRYLENIYDVIQIKSVSRSNLPLKPLQGDKANTLTQMIIERVNEALYEQIEQWKTKPYRAKKEYDKMETVNAKKKVLDEHGFASIEQVKDILDQSKAKWIEDNKQKLDYWASLVFTHFNYEEVYDLDDDESTKDMIEHLFSA